MGTYSNRTSFDVSRPYRDQTPPPHRTWGASAARESSERLVGSVASIEGGIDTSGALATKVRV